MIKNFNCYKNDEKKEGQPDYRLTAKVGENWVDIGAGWIKEGKNGKYISFALKKPYNEKPGFNLVEEKGEEVKKVEYPEENINLDDIPF